ncbi:hypothetical protein AMAG_07348 [Allomyces macrogynus ATCC 38327]|uniref:Uncharacterized protein n=1 Tax=Allomyces macrogynus (strain ATCC 38327) TaxID=578462 RepID=A0A0L0SHV5_ALLM3|nr:hypothetical protein AMAG_07348 [Allomyces macrogynus ATCC 38327]|eukprot:KNE62098.1 hypothetical protein AMAG_07348 [Allomyces macrogynus ATCC 38327]
MPAVADKRAKRDEAEAAAGLLAGSAASPATLHADVNRDHGHDDAPMQQNDGARDDAPLLVASESCSSVPSSSPPPYAPPTPRRHAHRGFARSSNRSYRPVAANDHDLDHDTDHPRAFAAPASPPMPADDGSAPESSASATDRSPARAPKANPCLQPLTTFIKTIGACGAVGLLTLALVLATAGSMYHFGAAPEAPVRSPDFDRGSGGGTASDLPPLSPLPGLPGMSHDCGRSGPPVALVQRAWTVPIPAAVNDATALVRPEWTLRANVTGMTTGRIEYRFVESCPHSDPTTAQTGVAATGNADTSSSSPASPSSGDSSATPSASGDAAPADAPAAPAAPASDASSVLASVAAELAAAARRLPERLGAAVGATVPPAPPALIAAIDVLVTSSPVHAALLQDRIHVLVHPVADPTAAAPAWTVDVVTPRHLRGVPAYPPPCLDTVVRITLRRTAAACPAPATGPAAAPPSLVSRLTGSAAAPEPAIPVPLHIQGVAENLHHVAYAVYAPGERHLRLGSPDDAKLAPMAASVHMAGANSNLHVLARHVPFRDDGSWLGKHLATTDELPPLQRRGDDKGENENDWMRPDVWRLRARDRIQLTTANGHIRGPVAVGRGVEVGSDAPAPSIAASTTNGRVHVAVVQPVRGGSKVRASAVNGGVRVLVVPDPLVPPPPAPEPKKAPAAPPAGSAAVAGSSWWPSSSAPDPPADPPALPPYLARVDVKASSVIGSARAKVVHTPSGRPSADRWRWTAMAAVDVDEEGGGVQAVGIGGAASGAWTRRAHAGTTPVAASVAASVVNGHVEVELLD